MQISASNLLVAAQQPQAQQKQLHSGFAQILGSAKAEAARYEPPSFAAAAPEAGGGEPAPAVQAQPYAPAQAPGTTLDIRI